MNKSAKDDYTVLILSQSCCFYAHADSLSLVQYCSEKCYKTR